MSSILMSTSIIHFKPSKQKGRMESVDEKRWEIEFSQKPDHPREGGWEEGGQRERRQSDGKDQM